MWRGQWQPSTKRAGPRPLVSHRVFEESLNRDKYNNKAKNNEFNKYLISEFKNIAEDIGELDRISLEAKDIISTTDVLFFFSLFWLFCEHPAIYFLLLVLHNYGQKSNDFRKKSGVYPPMRTQTLEELLRKRVNTMHGNETRSPSSQVPFPPENPPSLINSTSTSTSTSTPRPTLPLPLPLPHARARVRSRARILVTNKSPNNIRRLPPIRAKGGSNSTKSKAKKRSLLETSGFDHIEHGLNSGIKYRKSSSRIPATIQPYAVPMYPPPPPPPPHPHHPPPYGYPMPYPYMGMPMGMGMGMPMGTMGYPPPPPHFYYPYPHPYLSGLTTLPRLGLAHGLTIPGLRERESTEVDEKNVKRPPLELPPPAMLPPPPPLSSASKDLRQLETSSAPPPPRRMKVPRPRPRQPKPSISSSSSRRVPLAMPKLTIPQSNIKVIPLPPPPPVNEL